MDADPPGREAAVRIAGDLERHDAADVRIIELAPARDDGYDLSDWLRERNQVRTLTARTYTSGEYRRMPDSASRPRATSAGSSPVRGSSITSLTPAAVPGVGARSYGCAQF